MKIIDAHAHLMDEMYEKDREEVIQRCLEKRMDTIINIGFDEASSFQAVALAKQYDFMKAVVGLHPDACNVPNVSTDFVLELIKSNTVCAIGEVGLDYHYEETNRENQKEGFIRQIQLGNELSLPVVIHSRDADGDMMEILRKQSIQCGFVMHCFSSSVEIAKEVLKLGGMISLAGTVTFKNARNLLEVAKMVPLERLMIETDSPYLSPEPYRGTRNEPWRVWEVAKKIATIKEMPLEELVAITNQNIKTFYHL